MESSSKKNRNLRSSMPYTDTGLVIKPWKKLPSMPKIHCPSIIEENITASKRNIPSMALSPISSLIVRFWR